jgi:KipI family sensor histidine kinase inhibitor
MHHAALIDRPGTSPEVGRVTTPPAPVPSASDALRLLSAGEAALVVELGDAIDPAINARVHRLDAAIAAARLPGVVETIPTYRSILVCFDPLATEAAALGAAIRALAADLAHAPAAAGRRWIIPAAFGGEHGEDLAEVARRVSLSPAEVVALHTAADYRVYMLGFSPGFAYLGALPRPLHLPRREVPRLKTPAGTVMQGGAQAAISPTAMPSGWHLLGRTPVRLFDLARDPPFLLAPGDHVRFVAIPSADYVRLAADSERGRLRVESEVLAGAGGTPTGGTA